MDSIDADYGVRIVEATADKTSQVDEPLSADSTLEIHNSEPARTVDFLPSLVHPYGPPNKSGTVYGSRRSDPDEILRIAQS